MALNLYIEPVQILSDRKVAVNGPWFHVGGMALDVQFHGPRAFNQVEVSADKADADVATDADAAAISSVGPVYREIRERPEWMRAVVLTDQAGPSIYTIEFLVHKEDF